MTDFITPTTQNHFDEVRRLCWEYRDLLLAMGPDSVRIINTFYPEDKYTRLMDRLETDNAPPSGAIKLAVKNGQAIGCGMFHTLEPGIAEIKRVYVVKSARGTGAGLGIMRALIEQCHRDGFSKIRMDTGTPLKAAQKLYREMGFRERDPYYEVPDAAKGHLIFYEMDLGQK